MGTWQQLRDELDAWRELGRRASFWWRDDDAIRVTAELESLLRTRRRAGAPIAIAVIPAEAETDLRDRLREEENVAVLQHGYAHRNHAPPNSKKAEFGPHRPLAAMLAEISEGWRRIGHWHGALPAFVPPWNRIDPNLVPALPRAGFGGLSLAAPRASPEPARGVTQNNVHVDIVDWHGGRGFVGEERALATILAHLSARRRGQADAHEATGLLTHHRVHDRGCWSFLDRLLDVLGGHPGARWVGAAELFTERAKES